MEPYIDLIRHHAQRHNIDPTLLQALIAIESGGDPNAVSDKGAVGLGQLMPKTMADPGYGVAPIDPNKDPIEENIRFTSDYFAAMMDKYGDSVPDALAAYNDGPGDHDKTLAGERVMPDETTGHIDKVRQRQLQIANATGNIGAPPPSPEMLNEVGVDSPLMQREAPAPPESPEAEGRMGPLGWVYDTGLKFLSGGADLVGMGFDVMTPDPRPDDVWYWQQMASGVSDFLGSFFGIEGFSEYGQREQMRIARSWIAENERRRAAGEPTLEEERADQLGTWAAKPFEAFGEFLRDSMTDYQKQQDQEFAAAVDEGAGSTLGYLLRNPTAISALIAESGPAMLAGGGTGRVAKWAAGKTGKISPRTGGIAGSIAGESAIASGLNAQAAARMIDELPLEALQQLPEYAELARMGASEAEIRSLLKERAASTTLGVSLFSNLLTLGTSQALGANVVQDILSGVTKTTGRQMVAAFGKEFAQEFFQEGGDQLAGNIGEIASGLRDPEDLWEGVGGAAVAGGLAGGGTAVGLNTPAAIRNWRQQRGQPPEGGDGPPLGTPEAPGPDWKVDDIPVPNAAVAAGKMDMKSNLPPVTMPLMQETEQVAEPTVTAPELSPVEAEVQAFKTLDLPESGVVPEIEVANALRNHIMAYSPKKAQAEAARMTPEQLGTLWNQQARRARAMFPDLDDDSLGFETLKLVNQELSKGGLGGSPPEDVAVQTMPPDEPLAEAITPPRPALQVRNDLNREIERGKEARDKEMPPEITRGIDGNLIRLRRELQRAERYEAERMDRYVNGPPTWDTRNPTPVPQNADEALRSNRFVTHQTTPENLPGLAETGLNEGTHVSVGLENQSLGEEPTLVYPISATGTSKKRSPITGRDYNVNDRLTTRGGAQPTAILYDVDSPASMLQPYTEAFPGVPTYGIQYNEAMDMYLPADEQIAERVREETGPTDAEMRAIRRLRRPGEPAPATETAAEPRPADETGEFAPIPAQQKTNLRRMVRMNSTKLYGEDQVNVTVKELLQNARDASVGAIKAGKLDPSEATISIKVNSEERTIEVTDKGMGMDGTMLVDKFFALFESEKEGLDVTESAGGFGMAKIAYIYNNDRVQVRTTRDGVTYEVDATRQQLMDTSYQITRRPAEDGEVGTTVKVTIAEEVENDSDWNWSKRVPWPGNYVTDWTGRNQFLGKPMLDDDVTVELEVLRYEGAEPDAATLNMGAEFDPTEGTEDSFGSLKLVKLTTVEAPWGEIDIWITDKKHQWGNDARHVVMSNGIYQFDREVMAALTGGQTSEHSVIYNLRPNVPADHPLYPFSNSRESFLPEYNRQFGAIDFHMASMLQRRDTVDRVETEDELYKDPLTIQAVDYNDPQYSAEDMARFKEQAKATVEKGKETQQVLQTKKKPPIKPLGGNLKLTEDQKLTTADGHLLGSREAQVAAENAKDEGESYIDPNEALGGVIQRATVDMPGDPTTDVFIHNNLSPAYLEEASKHGEPMQFFAEIASVFAGVRDNYLDAVDDWRIRGPQDRGTGELNDPDTFWIGVSLDQEYHGANWVHPFRGMGINPVSGGARRMYTRGGQAGGMYRTMLHELAHITARHHRKEFSQAEEDIIDYMMDTGMDFHFRQAIEDIMDRHNDLYEWLIANFSQYPNLGKSLQDPATAGSQLDRAARDMPVEGRTVPTGRQQGDGGPLFESTGTGERTDRTATSARIKPGTVNPNGWIHGYWNAIDNKGNIRKFISKQLAVKAIEKEILEANGNPEITRNAVGTGVAEVLNLETGDSWRVYAPSQMQQALKDKRLTPAPVTPIPTPPETGDQPDADTGPADPNNPNNLPVLRRRKWNAILPATDNRPVMVIYEDTRKKLVDRLKQNLPGEFKATGKGRGEFTSLNTGRVAQVYGPTALQEAHDAGVAYLPPRTVKRGVGFGPEPPPEGTERPPLILRPPGEGPPTTPTEEPEPEPEEDYGEPPEQLDLFGTAPEDEWDNTGPDEYAPIDRPEMYTYKPNPGFNVEVDENGNVSSNEAREAAPKATRGNIDQHVNRPPPPPMGFRDEGSFGSWDNFKQWTRHGWDWFRYNIQDEHLQVKRAEDAMFRNADGTMDDRFAVHEALSAVPNMVSKANRDADEAVLNDLYHAIWGMDENGNRIGQSVVIPEQDANLIYSAMNALGRNYFTAKKKEATKVLERIQETSESASEELQKAYAEYGLAVIMGEKKAINKASRKIFNAKGAEEKKAQAVVDQLNKIDDMPVPDSDIVGGSGVSDDMALATIREIVMQHNIPIEQQYNMVKEFFDTTQYLRDEAMNRGRLTREEYEQIQPNEVLQEQLLENVGQVGIEEALDWQRYGLTKNQFYDQLFNATYAPAWDEETVTNWLDDPHGLDIVYEESHGHVDIFGSEFDKAEGRSERDGLATQPIQALHRMIYSTQRRGLYAKEVGERIYNSALGAEDARFAVALPFVPIESSDYSVPGARKQYITAALDKAAKLGGGTYTRTAVGKTPMIRIRRGDYEGAVILLDKSYANGLVKHYGKPSKEWIGMKVHDTSATVKRLITTWNPDFIAANAPREWINAIVQIDSIQGLTKEQTKAIKDKVRARTGFGTGEWWKWMKEIQDWSSTRRGTDEEFVARAPDEERRGLRRFITELAERGAFTELYNGATLQEIQSDMRRDLAILRDKAATGFSPRRGRYYARMFGRLLERAANTTENVPRAFVGYEVYQQLIESGVAHDQAMDTAARAAQNLSVNFKRFGAIGRKLWPFFFANPAIQGSARTSRAYYMAPIAMARIAVYGGILRMLNEALAGADDDDRSLYEKNVPDWARERSLVMVIPGTGGEYVSIPFAFGHNVTLALGEKLVSSVLGHDTQFRGLAEDLGDEAKNITALAFSSFTPIPVSRDTVQTNWLGYITPSMIQPIQELQVNRDWRGMPIQPEEFGNAPDALPDAYRVKNADPDSWAESAFRMMAIAMNSMTGGTRHKPGILDLHPKQIEHLMKSYTGSIGSVGTKTLEAATAYLSGEFGEGVRNTPILRKFYGLGESRFDDRARYFELGNRMIQLEDQRNYLRKNPGPDRMEYKAFMETEGEVWKKGIFGRYKATESRLRKLSRLRARLLRTPNRTQAQRDRIDRLDQLMTEAMLRFNNAYYDRIIDIGDINE